MAKGEAAAAAKTDSSAAAPAAAPAAVVDPKAAAAAAAPAADPVADEKPAKVEKTYTKAELDAAKTQAAAEAKKKFDEEKDLSDLEKLQKENAELRESNRLRDAKENVLDALKTAGARSPELIWKALKGDLEFDDKGGVKNLDALVTNFKTSFAEQFGIEKPGETIDGGAGQGAATGKLTKEKLATMKPAEIQKLDWEEVKKVMAGS